MFVTSSLHFLVDKVLPAAANTLSVGVSIAGRKGAKSTGSHTRFTSQLRNKANKPGKPGTTKTGFCSVMVVDPQSCKLSLERWFVLKTVLGCTFFFGYKFRFRARAWLHMVESSWSQMQIGGEYIKAGSYRPPPAPWICCIHKQQRANRRG